MRAPHPASCPSGHFYLFFFGPIALCPCHASFTQKSCSCSLYPHSIPQEISYHCCICNLWIRGLSIYYYWLIIIIIDYVNLPSVYLSRWVSEVTLGVEDALVPPPHPHPMLSRRQWAGATGWAPER